MAMTRTPSMYVHKHMLLLVAMKWPLFLQRHMVNDEPLETRRTTRNSVYIVRITRTSTYMCYY
jgi:hypothetical protein